MAAFQLFASPWWVNLVGLAPLVAFMAWRHGLRLSLRQLAYCAVFAIAFGFVEASVVVYLRAATGLLPGYEGTLADVQRQTADLARQAELLRSFPRSLMTVELFRETATMLMLASVALAAANRQRERWAVFFWCFAWWDITYYAGLWATIRWPDSLLAPDVLFLIPEPWLGQVWFPISVSALMLVAVAVRALQPETGTVRYATD